MAPGGSITDCDDCAWSACFMATDCIRDRARQLGVEPQDLLDRPVLFGVDFGGAEPVITVLTRNLTRSELEQLAAELPPGTLILNDSVATHD